MELLSVRRSFELINESTCKFDLRINLMPSAFLWVMISVISYQLLMVSVPSAFLWVMISVISYQLLMVSVEFVIHHLG